MGIYIVVLTAMVLASSTVECMQLRPPAWSGQNIPPRCVALSVTAVSCSQHTPDNLLPHPDDCELFYYCVSPEAEPFCRQCPAQLHFNPRLHVCDHPSIAGCTTNTTTPNHNTDINP